MLRLIVIVCVIYLVVSCKDSDKSSREPNNRTAAPSLLSYEQLVDYPNQCALADQQLKQLRYIQQVKKFDPDPDMLNETDRAYNSRLKATIWWYAYRCNKY